MAWSNMKLHSTTVLFLWFWFLTIPVVVVVVLKLAPGVNKIVEVESTFHINRNQFSILVLQVINFPENYDFSDQPILAKLTINYARNEYPSEFLFLFVTRVFGMLASNDIIVWYLMTKLCFLKNTVHHEIPTKKKKATSFWTGWRSV